MEPFTAIFDQVIKAIANPENWDNGRLNWNFVDADVFAAIQPKDVEQHYADYEAACVAIEEARCVRFPNTYEKEVGTEFYSRYAADDATKWRTSGQHWDTNADDRYNEMSA